MIALRKAFVAPHFAALVTKICSGAYDPLPTKTPAFLVNVIAGMLNVDANERWLLSDVLNSHEQFQLAAVTLRRAKKQGSSNTAATMESRSKRDNSSHAHRGEAVMAPLDLWVKSKQRDLLQIEAYLRPFRDDDAAIVKAIAQRAPKPEARPSAAGDLPLQAALLGQDLKAQRAKRMLASPAQKDSGRSSTPQEAPVAANNHRRSLSEELQQCGRKIDQPERENQLALKVPSPRPVAVEAPKQSNPSSEYEPARVREKQEAKREQSRLDMKAMIREARARKGDNTTVPVEIILPANLQGLPQNKM